MRGIVMEIKGKYAVILTEDGQFRKIKAQPGMTVGAETDAGRPMKAVSAWKPVYRIASVAASLLVVLGIGIFSYNMPYSYVDFDINPSIGLTANIYDRIIGVEALNDDGGRLIGNKDLRHMKLDEGVMVLLSSAVEQGYLSEPPAGCSEDAADSTGRQDSGDVHDAAPAQGETPDPQGAASRTPADGDPSEGGMITAGGTGAESGGSVKLRNAVMLTVSSSSAKKTDALKKIIENTAARELSKDNVDSRILVGGTSVKQRQAAHKLGVTPGKLALIEEVSGYFPGADFERMKNTAVKDLLEIVSGKEKRTVQASAANKAGAGKKEDAGKKESAGIKSDPGKKEDKEKEKKPAPGVSGKAGSANGGNNAGIARPQDNAVKSGPGMDRDNGRKDSKNNAESKDSEKQKGNTGSHGTNIRPGPGNILQSDGSRPGGSAGTGNAGKSNGKDAHDSKRPGWDDVWKTLEKQGEELKKEREKLRNELLGQINADKPQDSKKPGAKDPRKENEQDGKKVKDSSKQGGNKAENGNNTGKNQKNAKNDKDHGRDISPKTPGPKTGPKDSGNKK
ncbi:MAG TPA: anti-sigma factor domain-containing protein [Clostridiales bacterium]|nr:anti-sigma factor domain-containing protein [Clostridiales bacterium]HPV02042.1 anti-sigma factor domain-containing protein [Clostridiales bacterium]